MDSSERRPAHLHRLARCIHASVVVLPIVWRTARARPSFAFALRQECQARMGISWRSSIPLAAPMSLVHIALLPVLFDNDALSILIFGQGNRDHYGWQFFRRRQVAGPSGERDPNAQYSLACPAVSQISAFGFHGRNPATEPSRAIAR